MQNSYKRNQRIERRGSWLGFLMNSLTWAGLQVVGELCSLRASEPSVVVPHHCRRFGGGRRGHSLVLWSEDVLAPVSVWGQTELHAHHENHCQE